MALSDLLRQSLSGAACGTAATAGQAATIPAIGTTVSVPQLLDAIRHHLGMDVAFVSEFIDGRRVFRHVEPSNPSNPVQVGMGDPLEESYCQRVVDGRLPELMTDARQNPEARTIPATDALPVGAHLSVPIRLSDGSVYGTFCCFRFTSDETLDLRDHNMMKVFADVAAQLIESERKAQDRRKIMEDRILETLRGETLSIVYQPICDLGKQRVIGFEALSRFKAEPQRPPDQWFSDAREAGLGWPLESKAILMALEALDELPGDVFISVNISPEYILQGALDGIFSDRPLDRIVLEITEHAAVELYDELTRLMAPFRQRGLRIAVDDAGAGYASFRHILNLAPDRIKLDISLTHDIDRDPSRRALAAAFSRFSEVTGTSIVAEGVETKSELDTLQALGVSTVQGFYVGRPGSLGQAVERCQQ
jgi:EAL domain-containing protein (putative c-di-GMP-specific phosphodiesterase class I)